jgi:hypothetical protein
LPCDGHVGFVTPVTRRRNWRRFVASTRSIAANHRSITANGINALTSLLTQA